MTTLRILWVTENYFPSRGGMAQSCDRIVYALRQAGVTIDVAHFFQRAPRQKVEARRGGRDIICPVEADPAHAMNCLWNLLAKDRDAYTHVVAFGGTLPLIAAPVYAAWLGAALVTLIRGNDFDAAVFSPKRADVLREALQRSSRVCVVSRDKAEKIKALYPATRPVWIPNGIDLSEWEPLPSHLKRARKWRKANVEPGRRVLGIFGHIKPKKGGQFFLDTLLASGLAHRFHLLFVGELDEAIVEWLRLHESDVAYHIFPFLDRYELLAHYTACDLTVIASFYDGLPNVLLESAALGVPLLASTAGGMRDVLEDDVHGFLFHPGDVHECRKAIERAAAAADDDLKQLGDNCRALVETRLSGRLEVENYLAVLHATSLAAPGAGDVHSLGEGGSDIRADRDALVEAL